MLAGTPLKLLGVSAGGQCMQFLRGALIGETPASGMIIIGPDGLAYVTRAPQLSLPLVNPLADGAYPSNATWNRMFISAPNADEQPWQMVQAPSDGNWIVSAEGGLFKFKEATTGSSGTAPCTSGGTVGKIGLFGCHNSGTVDSPTYVLRRLTPINQRVVVGYDPGDGSDLGFRTLPADIELTHPLLRITTQARLAQLVTIDPATVNPFGTGIGTTVAFGTGAITDLQTVVYSPTTQQIHFRPPQVYSTTAVNTENRYPDSGNLPTSYTQCPNGHCQTPSLNIHYTKVLVIASLILYAGEDLDYALFRDGTLVREETMGGALISRCYVFHIDTVTPGAHNWEMRCKRRVGAVSGAATIESSSITVVTLPY